MPLHLGRKAIAVLVEYLESSQSWSQLGHLLFAHGLDARFAGANKLAALGAVFYPLAREGADPEEIQRAQDLLEEIVQPWLQTIKAHDENEFSVSTHKYETASSLYRRFQQALRADGLDLIEGRFAPFLSPTVAPAHEQGTLEARLSDLDFNIPLRHLEQAVDNAARGN